MNRLKGYLKTLPSYLFILILVWVFMVILMPKKSLWYEIEAVMAEQKVIVHDEKLDDALFSLDISDAELYFGAMNLARIEALEILPLGFYNSATIKNLFVGSELPILKGLHVKSAHLSYIPFCDIEIEASGNFGVVEGFVDLTKRTIELDVEASSWLKKQTVIMRKLRKQKKGYHFAFHY